jgi:hypothetical protein
MEMNVAITAARFVNFRKHKKVALIFLSRRHHLTRFLGLYTLKRGLSSMDSMDSIGVFEDYPHWRCNPETLLKITGTSSRGLSIRTDKVYLSR